MRRLAIDTSVLSHLVKPKPTPGQEVHHAEAQRLLQLTDVELAIPTPALAELLVSIPETRRGSHRSAATRVACAFPTTSGITTKSAASPMSWSARRNDESQNGSPLVCEVHAPLSSAYGNPSVRTTPRAETISRHPHSRNNASVRRVPVREA